MRIASRLIAASALLLCAAAGTTEALASRVSVGSVDKVQERVHATFQEATRPLATRSEILFQDRLQTGPRARLQATLRDGTRLTLGEKASMAIDEYVYDPQRDGERDKMALQVIEGAFLFVGGEIEGETGGNVEITTPVGVLAVRGTTVWGGAIDGGYGVLVLDGEVEVSTAGGSVTLSAGQATMIYDRAQAPEAPAPWSEEKVGRAVRTISFQ